MATRFDSKEYVKQRFLTMGSKYFPKDHLRINIAKRKGFKLADSTLSLIKQSIEIVTNAQETGEIVPASTANLYKYGTIFIQIFENLDQYQVITPLKSRSRRGYRKEVDILDFDLNKIELLLKKIPDPPIKIQKDKKMILDMKKNYFKQFENNEYQIVLEDILVKQKFFVQIGSDGNKFIESILRQLHILIAKITEKKDSQSLLVEIEDEIREIEIRIAELEDILPKLKDEIESFRKESGIFTHLSEKEKLLSDPDLSLFLKIITLCLEKYVKMVERRENRKLDQREDFLGLILEPTRFNNLTEDLWREIVYIIESHALELISSKSWFKFKNSDDLRNFVVKKDVLEKYARIRKLENMLDSIEQNLSKNPQYSEAARLVIEFNEKRSSYAKLNEKIPEVKEKIDTLSHELKIEEEKVFTYLV